MALVQMGQMSPDRIVHPPNKNKNPFKNSGEGIKITNAEKAKKDVSKIHFGLIV